VFPLVSDIYEFEISLLSWPPALSKTRDLSTYRVYSYSEIKWQCALFIRHGGIV
jgi:hypothetical protein